MSIFFFLIKTFTKLETSNKLIRGLEAGDGSHINSPNYDVNFSENTDPTNETAEVKRQTLRKEANQHRSFSYEAHDVKM